MDSGTLRLILIVAGIALLAAIYYLGQKKNEPKSQVWERHDQPEPDESAESTTWTVPEASEDEYLTHELEQLDEVIAESEQVDEPAIEISEELFDPPCTQHELFAEDALEITTVDNSDLPQKILQIMVVSQGQPFAGEQILQAAEACGLQPGEMQIFHHYSSHKKQPLFSMASVVEPGCFPFKDKEMEPFSTPGLMLFAQLPTIKPGIEIYDEMISTARKLADRLNGELQDKTRSVLSRQTIEHTREEILEYQRQIRLAGKRR